MCEQFFDFREFSHGLIILGKAQKEAAHPPTAKPLTDPEGFAVDA
jgi:hypothetical protein